MTDDQSLQRLTPDELLGDPAGTDPAEPVEKRARDMATGVALVGLGVSPVEALKAITVHSAEMMGMADRIGRLKQNYIADLIVVEGNPLEDIASLRRIRRVMKGGKWVGNTLEGAGKLFCD